MITRAEVESFLSERSGRPHRVRTLHQTFPGQSRETWIVESHLENGSMEKGYVLRIDPPGGGIVPLPLEREWKVYVRLAKTRIPVANPLWFGHEKRWFDGRPFFVRDLVPGSSRVAGLWDPVSGERLRRQVSLEHAERLAELHSLDWPSYGFDEVLEAPRTPEEAPQLELETWRRIWDAARLEPMPTFTRALHWFREQLPRTVPRVSLLKGNNGLGEEIWLDGRIVALSDWELASIGDPAQDWAFSQGLLDLWDREQTVAHYERHAGVPLSRENLDFWIVWTLFKATCCTHAGLRAFVEGRDYRVVLPAIGFGMVKVIEQVFAMLVKMPLGDAAKFVSAMWRERLAQSTAGEEATT